LAGHCVASEESVKTLINPIASIEVQRFTGRFIG
jgi:hypothetical protein